MEPAIIRPIRSAEPAGQRVAPVAGDSPEERAAGVVVAQGGQPVPGVRVVWGKRGSRKQYESAADYVASLRAYDVSSGPYRTSTEACAISDADGKFSFSRELWSGAETALIAWHPEHGCVFELLRVGQSPHRKLQFRPSARVSGRVFSRAGGAVSGAVVAAYVDRRASPLYRFSVERDGGYRSCAMPPGAYTLYVQGGNVDSSESKRVSVSTDARLQVVDIAVGLRETTLVSLYQHDGTPWTKRLIEQKLGASVSALEASFDKVHPITRPYVRKPASLPNEQGEDSVLQAFRPSGVGVECVSLWKGSFCVGRGSLRPGGKARYEVQLTVGRDLHRELLIASSSSWPSAVECAHILLEGPINRQEVIGSMVSGALPLVLEFSRYFDGREATVAVSSVGAESRYYYFQVPSQGRAMVDCAVRKVEGDAIVNLSVERKPQRRVAGVMCDKEGRFWSSPRLAVTRLDVSDKLVWQSVSAARRHVVCWGQGLAPRGVVVRGGGKPVECRLRVGRVVRIVRGSSNPMCLVVRGPGGVVYWSDRLWGYTREGRQDRIRIDPEAERIEMRLPNGYGLMQSVAVPRGSDDIVRFN